jgi:DUF2892 family protein
MRRQIGNLSSAERATSALLGAALSGLALRRGSPLLRILGGVAGVALLSRAAAGHCAMKAAVKGDSSVAQGMKDQWHQLRRASTDVWNRARGNGRGDLQSAVDDSVEQTFPASDPPASRLQDVPPANADQKWASASKRSTEPGV